MVKLQDRDYELLYHARMLGDLKSRDHILKLFDGKMRVLRRASMLAREGYLYELPGRRAYEQASYGIGNRGAKVVEERYGVPATSSHWPQKHVEKSDGFRAHEHLNARMVIAIMKAAEASHAHRYISLKEIYDRAPEERRAKFYRARHPRRPKEHPFCLETSVYFDGVWKNTAIKFDWMFGIEGKRPIYFYLETDRGTMDVRTHNLHEPSLMKKMIVYRELAKRVSKKSPSINEQIFGVPQIRPLFLITARNPRYAGAERMKNAIEMLQELGGARDFLFCDRTFFDHEDPLQAPLIDGAGEDVRLGDLDAC